MREYYRVVEPFIVGMLITIAFLIAALAMSIRVASPASYMVYDNQNRPVQVIDERPDNQGYNVYDPNGTFQGSFDRKSNGDYHFYNANGQYRGTLEAREVPMSMSDLNKRR